MKMKQTLLATALTVPLMLGGATALAAEGHHKGDRDGRGHGGKHCGESAVMHQLDLTDAQKAELKTQREAHKQDMKNAMAAQADNRKAQREAHQQAKQALVLAETFNKMAATELASDLADQHAKMMVMMLEREHAKLSILTPEQKERYVELKQHSQDKCRDQKSRRDHKKDPK